jgi:hypothetical protein
MLKHVKLLINSFLIFSSFLPLLISYGYGSPEAAFVVDVPFYCPASKIAEAEPFIKQEYEHRCKKYNQHKDKKCYNVTIFSENDFEPGKEPFKIAGDKFRGCLRLYESRSNRVTLTTTSPLNVNGGVKPLNTTIKSEDYDFIYSTVRNETGRINSFINLFRDEAFGVNAHESRERFKQSMVMVLLLNRYKSISSTLNKSLKRYLPELDQAPNVVLLRGFWEPKWVDNKGKPVPLKHVHHFFLQYLRRNADAAINFLKTNEEGRLRDLLSKKGKKSTKITFNMHVPYRELREALRIHPRKILLTQELTKSHPGKPIYEAIHDDDLALFRVKNDLSGQEYGLYSHYEMLIRTHNQPEMITTGYRASEIGAFQNADEFASIYVGIEEDRYCRADLSKVDARLAYYAEPNIMVKVNTAEGRMPYSFLDRASTWSLYLTQSVFDKYESPHESFNILDAIYSANPNAVVIFDASHPVVMKLPERMLKNKQGGRHEVGIYEAEQSKILPPCNSSKKTNMLNYTKISEHLSQSALSFRNYAVVAHMQLGLSEKTLTILKPEQLVRVKVGLPQNVFRSILCTILNSYDPINFIETYRTYTVNGAKFPQLPMLESIEYIVGNYAYFADMMPMKFKGDISDENVSHYLRQFNQIGHFGNKLTQIQHLKNIFNSVFTIVNWPDPISKLVEAAQALGKRRNDILRAYYKRAESYHPYSKIPSFQISKGSSTLSLPLTDVQQESSIQNTTLSFSLKKEKEEEGLDDADYHYTDQDIWNILKHEIAADNGNDPHKPLEVPGTTNFVCHPMSLKFHKEMEENIIGYLQRYWGNFNLQSNTCSRILIPLSLGKHWITLLINKIDNPKSIEIWYIDSLEPDSITSQKIDNSLKPFLKAFLPSYTYYFNEKIKREQPDQHACGPITVENILDYAGIKRHHVEGRIALTPQDIKDLRGTHIQILLPQGIELEGTNHALNKDNPVREIKKEEANLISVLPFLQPKIEVSCIAFTEDNYHRLLDNLKNSNYGLKEITKWAGFSGSRPPRDFDSMNDPDCV